MPNAISGGTGWVSTQKQNNRPYTYNLIAIAWIAFTSLLEPLYKKKKNQQAMTCR